MQFRCVFDNWYTLGIVMNDADCQRNTGTVMLSLFFTDDTIRSDSTKCHAYPHHCHIPVTQYEHTMYNFNRDKNSSRHLQ